MITDEIFEQLKAINANLTENKFSTKYLKASRSYLCNRRNKKKDVSNDVLLSLYAELSGMGAVWTGMAENESDETRRKRWDRLGTHYSQLANKVVMSLLERAKA